MIGNYEIDGHVRSVSGISAELAKIREQQPASATVKGTRLKPVRNRKRAKEKWLTASSQCEKRERNNLGATYADLSNIFKGKLKGMIMGYAQL